VIPIIDEPVGPEISDPFVPRGPIDPAGPVGPVGPVIPFSKIVLTKLDIRI
jgi:hypothetical protein